MPVAPIANLEPQLNLDIDAFLKRIFQDNTVMKCEALNTAIGKDPGYSALSDQAKDALKKLFSNMPPEKAIPQKLISSTIKKYQRAQATSENTSQQAQLRKLRTFLASSSQELTVDVLHGQVFLVPSTDFATANELQPVTEDTLLYEIRYSQFNARALLSLPEVQELMDIAKSKTFIEDMDLSDFLEILGILIDLAKGDLAPSDVTFRVGIGGSAETPPVRVISYLIPLLSIAKRYKAVYGIAPTVEAFTGQEGAIACNGFDALKVISNTKKAEDLLVSS